jgi:D-glycero-alpha-D-manno-heptose-7-phosphate kinase
MIVVRTPFRLPLGGGGTDLPSYFHKYEGFLITSAVNKYMYININEPSLVNKIKVQYSKVDIVDLENINSLKHEIVREALKYLRIKRPLEISSMADLSAGTGMGSSSSYTVGLLQGLNAMLRRHISLHELAEEACKVEIDLLGKPIGKQDQYAATYGGIVQMEIDRLGNVKITPIELDQEVVNELENRLMMFYTHIERDTNEILTDQNMNIRASEELEEQAQALPTPPPPAVGGRIGAVESMHRIKNIGHRIKDALLTDNIDEFGALLHEHWMTKRLVTDRMSSPDIDSWYNLAMENGALGGKIMGAGGGGFFVFCVENGKRKHLRKTMENAGLRYMNFKFDWEGSKVLVDI